MTQLHQSNTYGRQTIVVPLQMLRTCAIAMVCLALVTSGRSDTIFFEDFQEDPGDGPVRWTSDRAMMSIQDDGLVVFGSERPVPLADAREFMLLDTSIRARMKLIDGGHVGVAVRSATQLDGTKGFYGLVSADGFTQIGIRGPGIQIASGNTEVNWLHDDVIMQLDVIEDDLSLWVWKPGELMPEQPTVEVSSHLAPNPGHVSVGGVSKEFPSPGAVETLFRFVHLADEHIPFDVADFDDDGQLTAADLDFLNANFGASKPRFDLTGDGLVDSADQTKWIKEEMKTFIGDSNLDGEFNSGDLVAVFQAGEYEDNIPQNSSWATGDWNGDGDFDTGDLVHAFQDGGFEQGPQQAVIAVPEPTSFLMLMAGLTAIAIHRRQVHR